LAGDSVLPAARWSSSGHSGLTGTTTKHSILHGRHMAVGGGGPNAIPLVTFAERERATRNCRPSAVKFGTASRPLRPILMTILAMTAGMLPMSLGFGSNPGKQIAPRLDHIIVRGWGSFCDLCHLLFVASGVLQLLPDRVQREEHERIPSVPSRSLAEILNEGGAGSIPQRWLFAKYHNHMLVWISMKPALGPRYLLATRRHGL